MDATAIRALRRSLGHSQATFAREVGVSPGTVGRWEQGKAVPGPGALSRLRVLEAGGGNVEHNLPAANDELIGRGEDMMAIEGAIGSSRLVSVCGPGGVGKSRVAVATAWGLLPRFTGGAWLVELGGLTEGSLVPASIAASLKVGERLDDPLSAVVRWMASCSALVVLDNCEHLLDAVVEAVTTLLRACPELRVLTTSRAPLDLRGEEVIEVDGLACPASDSLDDVAASPSVELFVRHARARDRAFELSPTNTAAVASICRRLDGLPLALELAAMWVDVLSLQEIEKRLDDRFGLLTRAPRDLPQRQQTLRAVLDWSFELLDEDERRLITRLGVLPGRFDRRVAAVVNGSDEAAVTEPLARLRAKSLVQATERSGEMTFTLLDTTRAYARAILVADGDFEDLRATLAASLHETAITVEYLGGQAALLREFDTNIDSYRSVLGWLARQEAWDHFLQIAVTLWLYLDLIGSGSEACHWLEMGLDDAHADAVDQGYRGLGLSWLAHTRWRQGAPQEALVLAKRSIDIFEDFGEPFGVAWAQQVLACAEMTLGCYDEAQELLEAATATFVAGGQDSQTSHALMSLGQLIDRRGDRAAAERVLGDALCLARKVGNELRVALVLNSLAVCAERDRDVATSRQLRQELRALAGSLGLAHARGLAQMGLAFVALVDGDVDDAEATAQQALATLRSSNYHDTEMATLALLGTVRRIRGDFAGAARYQAAALDGRISSSDVVGVGQSLAAISRLAIAVGAGEQAARWLPVALRIGTRGTFSSWEDDEETVASLGSRWDPSAATSQDAAMAEAMAWCTRLASSTSNGAVGSKNGALSRREAEIIGLVGAGLSDKQIAVSLAISDRTVSAHLSAAYRKLGARNRTDAVRIFSNQAR